MTIKVFQKGFNYSQDGPGNRLVYHLQGCNMHCPWCANPESMSRAGTLMTTDALLLDSVCPHGAIREKQLDRARCAVCADRYCISSAGANRGITLSCVKYSVDELADEVRRSAPMFFDGGGVTFTGGEPTVQFEPLALLLERLRSEGIHCAIETNATHPRLPELFGLLDLLMLDCKHWNSRTLQSVTGADGEAIRQNLHRAVREHANVAIRIPLIGGFNAEEKDVTGFCNYFRELELGGATLELLPYHEYGKDKWRQCGMDYRMEHAAVSPEMFARFREAFEKQNIRVIRT